MMYDCMLNQHTQEFIIAKPIGWMWSAKEEAFEHVYTDNIDSASEDFDIVLDVSWGELTIKASDLGAIR